MSEPIFLHHRTAAIILYTLLITLQTHLAISSTDSFACLDTQNTSEISDDIDINVTSTRLEECMTGPEIMESETSRRVLLMQKRYISYETLRRDMVPCAKPGVSYYSCHAAQANPYSRGCEVITRCRGSIRDIKN